MAGCQRGKMDSKLPGNFEDYGKLCVSVRPGEYFMLGDHIEVQVTRVGGGRLNLLLTVPKSVKITRGRYPIGLQDKTVETPGRGD